ncbi:hypothetical protein ABZ249_30250 [Nocardiopsis sp. NPDC006139]|uniref:hypothetical protein n=1 Tax=Nocardiopsis sp. NPDC006139 TaxID=3154578 RepID=UPI0033A8960C
MTTLKWAADHGTLSCYRAGCRNPECVEADRDYTRTRRRLIAYGRPTTDLVDAEPVREHAKALLSLGWGLAELQAEARSNISTLLYGAPNRNAKPLKRINPVSARKILSIPLTMVPTTNLVDAAGSRRRVQALCVLGYAAGWQACQIGASKNTVQYLATGPTEKVQARWAVGIRDLYDRLWDVPAAETKHSKITRTNAVARGWLPPLAWDDDLIDFPDAELAAELSRRAEAMDSAELVRCYKAAAEGDRSPLIVAGAARHLEVRREKRTARTAA